MVPSGRSPRPTLSGRCPRAVPSGLCAVTGRHPPRVLLIAPPGSYRVHAYSTAADALGIELLIASTGRHALSPAGTRGLHLEADSPDAAVATILDEASRSPFSGVVSTDDATSELASQIGNALGLPHNPPRAARRARRKDLAREALAEAALPVPWFLRLDLTARLGPQLREVEYPCVVKPVALSASRGVIRANNPAELEAAIQRVSKMLADLTDATERDALLLEGYLPGAEIAVEGMLSNGALDVLAIFDKPDPLKGPFFEETYYVTPTRLPLPLQDHVRTRVQQACDAYGLREGPIHAELRVYEGEAWILEVAARTIGGDCSRLLSFGAGQTLEAMVLAHAIGRPLVRSSMDGAAGVLMLPTPAAGTLRRVEGVLAAGRVPWIEDVVIAVREGYELVPLPEGSSYLGFIFARAPTPEQVESALREAHACLNVVVAPAWRLEPA